MARSARDVSAPSPRVRARRSAKPSLPEGRAAPEEASDSDATRGGSVDYIVREILRGLHEGRYVPGQKLIENDLARKFGMGRGSIREALRRLEAEGLVSANLHRGARIRMLDRDAVRDMMEVTEHLVSLAARLAAERAVRSEEVRALSSIVAELERLAGDADSFEMASLRREFLRQLVSLANNAELAHLLPRLDISVAKAQFRPAFDRDYMLRDLGHMRDVVDAIFARDGQRAERAMRTRAKDTAIAIQRLSDEHFGS